MLRLRDKYQWKRKHSGKVESILEKRKTESLLKEKNGLQHHIDLRHGLLLQRQQWKCSRHMRRCGHGENWPIAAGGIKANK